MTWYMRINSNLLLSCSLLILLILSLCYNPLIKQLKGEEMEKKIAAWLCLHVSLRAEHSCWTARVCMQSLPVSQAPRWVQVAAHKGTEQCPDQECIAGSREEEK